MAWKRELLVGAKIRETDKKKKKFRNAFSGETKFMEVNKGDELDLSSLQNKQKEIRGKKRLKMEWGRFY